MKAIILAGGLGTRLWPLSRKNLPKQFLKIFKGKSFLKITYERLLKLLKPEDIIIITHKSYKNLIKKELLPYKEYSLILEPERKNTGPAITLAVLFAKDILSVKDEEIFLVCPSDHYLEPVQNFIKGVKFAKKIAGMDYIITFGSEIKEANPNLGYIKRDTLIKKEDYEAYKIEKFIEKPSSGTIRKFIQQGTYYWKMGIFVFKLNTLLKEFEKHSLSFYKLASLGYKNFLKNYSKLPNISFDYLEMEKTEKGAVIPLNTFWVDVGSYDGLYHLFLAKHKKRDNNICKGEVVCFESKNNLILGNKKLICTVGTKDLIVVDTQNVTLILKRGASSKIKNLLEHLENKKLPRNQK